MFNRDTTDRRPPENMQAYIWVNDSTGEKVFSPFPVILQTIHEEFLGAGVVVGQIEENNLTTPLVRIEDETAVGGYIYLTGEECTALEPVPELVDELAGVEILSALRYALRLDAEKWISLD